MVKAFVDNKTVDAEVHTKHTQKTCRLNGNFILRISRIDDVELHRILSFSVGHDKFTVDFVCVCILIDFDVGETESFVFGANSCFTGHSRDFIPAFVAECAFLRSRHGPVVVCHHSEFHLVHIRVAPFRNVPLKLKFLDFSEFSITHSGIELHFASLARTGDFENGLGLVSEREVEFRNI